MFSTTLVLQLEVGLLGNILTNNATRYSPTLRQLPHSECMPLVVAHLDLFDEENWAMSCAELRLSGSRSVQKAHLPLMWKWQALQRRIKMHSSAPRKTMINMCSVNRPASGQAVLKRPASQWEVSWEDTSAPSVVPLKVTAFNRKRF